MLLPFNINVNVNGIPCLRSTSVNVTATDVRFDFNSHRNIGRPFVGIVVVQLAQTIPTGTQELYLLYLLPNREIQQPLLLHRAMMLPQQILQAMECIWYG